MQPDDHERVSRAVKRICTRVDSTQPHARQLEQVAAAAVGYGLRKATAWSAHGSTMAPGLRGRIETAVAEFAAPHRQESLYLACRKSGVPQFEGLAGVVLRHCHEDLRPLTTEQVARYALEFALALAATRPALAEQYRRWLGRM